MPWIMRRLSKILDWINIEFCAGCGTQLDLSRPLCDCCIAELEVLRPQNQIHFSVQGPNEVEYRLRLLPLYLWPAQPAPQQVRATLILKNFLSGLKGSPTNSAVQFAVNSFLATGEFLKNNCKAISACPGRSGKVESDHSGAIAKALSDELAVKFLDGLTKSDLRKQKEKDRESRMDIEFNFNSSGFVPDEVVFFDDIVTTGATAIAIWKALGKPLQYQVWTIAWRGRIGENPCYEIQVNS